MSFSDTTLAIELDDIHSRENKMYDFYTELLKELKNNRVKEKIKFIRNQEIEHIKMVTDIISILSEYVNK